MNTVHPIEACKRRLAAMLPPPGYGRRMRCYLAEMYPLLTRLALFALLYLGLDGFLRRVHGLAAPPSLSFSVIGIWSLFALGLTVRLMDELKDKAIDRALFPERPLPSGKVLETDIVFSLVLAIASFLAANLWAGPVFWVACAVLGYALLMFRHFFMRRLLERSLAITLATHNPLVPLVLFYAVAVSATANGLTWSKLDGPAVALFIGMNWAMLLGIEIARKIRALEGETAYVTYSQLWGPRFAVLVAAAIQTVTFGIGLYFYSILSLSRVFLLFLLVAYAQLWWGHLRFLIAPSIQTSQLRPFADAYVLLVLIAQALAFGGPV